MVSDPDNATRGGLLGSASEEVTESDFVVNRALPPWALTVLRTGVKRKRPDARKVWGKVVSVAMCCRRRGWTEVQFVEEIWAQETRIYSGGELVYGYWPLMIQLLTTVKGNKSRAQRQIDRAWATAGDNLQRDCALKTPEDFQAEVLEWAWAWEERLDEGVDNLSATQKLVMRYVTASVEKGTTLGSPAPAVRWVLLLASLTALRITH